MNNKKGQSLIEIVFSIGIVILVLTGVVVLIISTAKIKRISLERQRAVELSQMLIEKKVLEFKNDALNFWPGVFSLNGTIIKDNNGATINTNFVGYLYDVEYKDCVNKSCNIIYTVKWGNAQTLSVERLFVKQGT